MCNSAPINQQKRKNVTSTCQGSLAYPTLDASPTLSLKLNNHFPNFVIILPLVFFIKFYQVMLIPCVIHISSLGDLHK